MRMREGDLHVAMRNIFKAKGWTLIAGEFPGGSDHELYPLNVVDPSVAKDNSPDPRRHSQGELIPDLVAMKDNVLLIGECKVAYDSDDSQKLLTLLNTRFEDFTLALEKFAVERKIPELLPVNKFRFIPFQVFAKGGFPNNLGTHFGFLKVSTYTEGTFFGLLSDENNV
ncbi:hypothetical protein ACG90B_19795 [Acinetobacter baumannii]|uniref:hypothetical protein n=1 Tax=Acinetobacter baumannii TaxID=470 RepID=UPI003891B00D